MSYTELLVWLAEYQRRPWGEDIADLRAGIIASTVASGATGKSYKPGDFMPRFTPEPEMSDEEIERTLDAAFGGRHGNQHQ